MKEKISDIPNLEKLNKKLESDTWYYGFIIQKKTNILKKIFNYIFRIDNHEFKFLISKSHQNPTLPTGYENKKRLQGAIKTDSKSEIIPFMQV